MILMYSFHIIAVLLQATVIASAWRHDIVGIIIPNIGIFCAAFILRRNPNEKD